MNSTRHSHAMAGTISELKTDSLTMVYTLSSADVDDNDNMGERRAESAFGTSSNNEDTDGDGTRIARNTLTNPR